jgi:hypothetical protein
VDTSVTLRDDGSMRIDDRPPVVIGDGADLDAIISEISSDILQQVRESREAGVLPAYVEDMVAQVGGSAGAGGDGGEC